MTVPPSAVTFGSIEAKFTALAVITDPALSQAAAGDLVVDCLTLLATHARNVHGNVVRATYVTKNYEVFIHGGKMSRPVNDVLFINDPLVFRPLWDQARAVGSVAQAATFPDWNTTFYTAVGAFACVYDLYRPTSRKTPGTFMEIIISNLLRLVTGRQSGKHIPLPSPHANLTTDLYIKNPTPSGVHLVVPCKITTRERISQPYVHQRILDAAYPNQYRSALVAMSELQRDDKNSTVNEICVPDQIALYHAFIAQLSGLYYLDLPHAYAALRTVHTGTLQTLMTVDLPKLL